jgi:hypothetical protein
LSGPVLIPNESELFRIVFAINQLAQGRSNAVGSFTCTENAATTTVLAPTCAAGSSVLLMPTTANAAAEFGNGTIYVATATVTAGQFIVTHANSATASRTFYYACLG